MSKLIVLVREKLSLSDHDLSEACVARRTTWLRTANQSASLRSIPANGSLRFVTVRANQNTPLRIVSRPIEALHCATCPDQSEHSVARRILTNQNTPPLRADQSEPPLPPHPPPVAHCIPTADQSAPSLRPIRARRCGACTVPAARPMRSAR